jgi:hypothetical protein
MVSVPLLKVGEALTKEVQDDNHPAQAGDFINALTGDTFGRQVGFIIAYYQKGRFAVDPKTKRPYVAFTEDIPEGWSEFVGESFVGTPFSEYPDAEETYKERANRKEIEWGKGPLISTTHNFTGLAIVQLRDAEDQLTDETELQPVRLSLKRTNTSAVRKILDLKKMQLRPPKMFWSRVFDLTTEKKQFNSGASHLVVPRLGRATTDAEVEAAIELATAVAAGRVQEAGDKLDTAVEPEAKGGLAV